MELSELIQFKGEYLAPDDKTGIVYKLKKDAAVPWVYLGDGDGQSEHAFKTEWMTVKGNAIYAGSHGTEWLNDDGSIKNYNRMFIKKITTYGNVFHLNWTENYQKLRSKLEIDYPGYVIHEAVLWSEVHKRWFFLPRQVSRAPVMKNSFDNMQGSNLLLTTSDCFCDITITEIGPLKLELGFSSLTFVPGTNDNLIVAIKTFERTGYPSTSFLMLFDIHGQLFLDSVVDNLLPAAMPFLLTIYKDKDEADKAWEFLVSSRIYGLAVGCFLSVLFSNRPLLIALFVQSFVHLDDWLWISYSTQIFENVGLTANRAQRASLLMSLPQAIISLALLGCFDNFSRRALLIIPTMASVVFGMLAIFFTIFEKALLHGIPIAIILPVLAAFDLSAAAISGESAFAIVPELFLHNDKILGTAIVGIAQNVFGGILTNCLLTAVNHLGTGNVLVPFVGMNVVYVVVNYWYLPETAEKTPQEVSIHFSADPPLQGTITYMSRKLGDLYHFFVPAKLFSFANILNILIFVAQVAFCVIFMNVFYGVGVQIFRLLVH
ncbi:unnamed protein product, partial [Mesorhabditis spiculigera]